MRTLFVLLCLFTSQACLAANFKFRAREHYEWHKIKSEGATENYQGFSNTLNLWHEEPYKISYGLAMGPIIGSAKTQEEDSVNFGDQIRLFSVGAELKYYPLEFLTGFYTRVGAGWSHLRSRGELNKLDGHHGYLGLGWEFAIGKAGLAFEVAQRMTVLDSNVTINTITPSVGLHFYKM